MQGFTYMYLHLHAPRIPRARHAPFFTRCTKYTRVEWYTSARTSTREGFTNNKNSKLTTAVGVRVSCCIITILLIYIYPQQSVEDLLYL